jgi:hypothetical protein
MGRAYGREYDRPHQRSPEFGRMFVFPGWERDW